MVGLSIVWIPVIASMQGGQLYIYIQAIAAYLSPPIAAVYVLAVLWKRANEQVNLLYYYVKGMIGYIQITLATLYFRSKLIKNKIFP